MSQHLFRFRVSFFLWCSAERQAVALLYLQLLHECQRTIVQYLMSVKIGFVLYIVYIFCECSSFYFILFYWLNLERQSLPESIPCSFAQTWQRWFVLIRSFLVILMMGDSVPCGLMECIPKFWWQGTFIKLSIYKLIQNYQYTGCQNVSFSLLSSMDEICYENCYSISKAPANIRKPYQAFIISSKINYLSLQTQLNNDNIELN